MAVYGIGYHFLDGQKRIPVAEAFHEAGCVCLGYVVDGERSADAKEDFRLITQAEPGDIVFLKIKEGNNLRIKAIGIIIDEVIDDLSIFSIREPSGETNRKLGRKVNWLVFYEKGTEPLFCFGDAEDKEYVKAKRYDKTVFKADELKLIEFIADCLPNA